MAGEIAVIEARLARAERMTYLLGGVSALLFLVLFAMLTGHAGTIARLTARSIEPETSAVLAAAGPLTPALALPAVSSTKIEATSFVLRDKAGNPRIMMGVNPDDSTALVVRGATAPTRCGITVMADGSMALAFLDGAVPILTVTGREGGEAGIVVGKDHKVALLTAPDYRGASVVVSGHAGDVIGHLP